MALPVQLRVTRERLAHVWRALLIGAAATALIAVVSRGAAFSDFNWWTYDYTIVATGLEQPSSDLVFVDFDEKTFDRVRQFPLPRTMVAQVIDAIAKERPKVIGLDMFLSESRTAADDAGMRGALTHAGNVIVASQLPAGPLPAVTPLPAFCTPEAAGSVSGFCVDGQPGALGFAFINLPFDSDGYIRDANLFAGTKPPSESFALMLAQQFTGTAIEPVDAGHVHFRGKVFPLTDAAGKTYLIGSWSREPARQVSALDLLDGHVPPELLRDKLVLVGQSNDAARDTHYTPLLRYAGADGARLKLPGTQIHAAAIRTLLEGTAVRVTPATALWAVTGTICGVAGLLLLSTRLRVGVAAVCALAVLVTCLSLLLYSGARIWFPFFPVLAAMLLTVLGTVAVQYLLERTTAREQREQRAHLMRLFSSYVDPGVAQTIWERRDELSLAGEERIATVMFSDIRSFTRMSAGRKPAEVLGWLNQYLSAMDEVIRAHGGFLNKFIGDGLMIIFGLPLSAGSPQRDAERAVAAAQAMLARVALLNEQNRANPITPQLRIGVGIHTGTLVAGSIGSTSRQEYSVIGDTVNLASRLESLNKHFGTEILLSEATRNLLGYTRGIESLGMAQVAGVDEPVPVYTVSSGEQASLSKERALA